MQVGAENCLIIDHGSTDGSTDDVGSASVMRIPRVPFNDTKRAGLISNIATGLLQVYDAVIYSDCDELLIANPSRFTNLTEYADSMTAPSENAIGLNLVHRLDLEGPLNSTSSLMSQRQYVQFVSPMCKPLLIRQPTRWSGGFHGGSHPPSFNELFLFHTRWVDLGECLKRLSVTRAVTVADRGAGAHHRAEYVDYVEKFRALTSVAVEESFDFSDLTQRVCKAFAIESDGLYMCRTDIRSQALYRVPEVYRSVI
jgi:hypothetical protein